jgi:hypothetical protein
MIYQKKKTVNLNSTHMLLLQIKGIGNHVWYSYSLCLCQPTYRRIKL